MLPCFSAISSFGRVAFFSVASGGVFIAFPIQEAKILLSSFASRPHDAQIRFRLRSENKSHMHRRSGVASSSGLFVFRLIQLRCVPVLR